MQKAGFSYWEDRIAPVFDVARQIRIIGVEAGRIVQDMPASLDDEDPAVKAVRLSDLGIETLICGAISRPFSEMILAHGIKVIPFVAGSLEEVMQAWISNGMKNRSFVMPGCRRGRWWSCRAGGHATKGMMMQEESGSGYGGGRGRRGQRRGGVGGPGGGQGGGPYGFCVCPVCGRREAHERGMVCAGHRCPACGSAMIRE